MPAYSHTRFRALKATHMQFEKLLFGGLRDVIQLDHRNTALFGGKMAGGGKKRKRDANELEVTAPSLFFI